MPSTSRSRLSRFARVVPIVAIALLAGACGKADPPAAAVRASDPAASGAGVGLVPPADAWNVVQAADERLVILDVRTQGEYDEGHLARAMLIDFYATDFADRIKRLDRGRQYVLYCRSGNRSGQARSLMADLGFTEVYDVDGGILAWQAAGLPVTTS